MSYIRYKQKRTWHWMVGHRSERARIVIRTACGADEGQPQEGCRTIEDLRGRLFCGACVKKIQEVYDILVEHCAASDSLDERRAFAVQWPDCVEYRFMGELGFGGKVWWSRGKCYVTTYPEARTDERDAMVAAANEALSLLLGACDQGGRNDGTLRVCCSTHKKILCGHHYARTHFVEIDPDWAPEHACNAVSS